MTCSRSIGPSRSLGTDHCTPREQKKLINICAKVELRVPADRGGPTDPIGFRDWVRSRRVTHSPRGDFITDARRDELIPPDFATFDDLYCYLTTRRRACQEAIEAARKLWNEFARRSGRPIERNRDRD